MDMLGLFILLTFLALLIINVWLHIRLNRIERRLISLLTYIDRTEGSDE